MKPNLLFLLALIFGLLFSRAQAGVGTSLPNASAELDIVVNDKGVLVPRLNIADLDTAAPVSATEIQTSLFAYNTNTTTGVVRTLSWDKPTATRSEIVANPQTAIRISRWNSNECRWRSEGGIVDTNGKTVSKSVALNSYRMFTFLRVNEGIQPENLEIYTVVTLNDDDRNDYFYLEGMKNLISNKVKIFNRSGVKIFETDDGDTYRNVFKGLSDGRVTIERGALLPSHLF
ncbi:MAG: hypothetical protein Mars2KO_35140 [Maribacter sp.]